MVIQTSIQVQDNSAWGIFADGTVSVNRSEVGPTATLDFKTSHISNNGHNPECFDITDPSDIESLAPAACTGGGIGSQASGGGASGPTVNASLLEVTNNNGPGIAAKWSIHLRQVKVSFNEGPGIQSTNKSVFIETLGTPGSDTNEVMGNKGYGILAGEHAEIYTSIQVQDNSAWGILADGVVIVNRFRDLTGALDTKVSHISNNGKDPACFDITDPGDVDSLAPAVCDGGGIGSQKLNVYASLIEVVGNSSQVEGEGGHGIAAAGDVDLRQATILANDGIGVSAGGNVTILGGQVCGNAGGDIDAPGTLDLQDVIYGDACGFMVVCPDSPFTVAAGVPETVTIAGSGFDDAEGVVDSVKVQRGGLPANVSFTVDSNVRISAVITASSRGKLPRLQTLMVHKSDGSKAICEDSVEVLP